MAQELGYANRGTAHRIVSQALEAREVESVDLLRQLELDRLDALQLAVWPRAMRGEVPAVLAVLRVLDQRIRLLRLAKGWRKQKPPKTWPSCQGPATVVIHRTTAGIKGGNDTAASPTPLPARVSPERPARRRPARRRHPAVWLAEVAVSSWVMRSE